MHTSLQHFFIGKYLLMVRCYANLLKLQIHMCCRQLLCPFKGVCLKCGAISGPLIPNATVQGLRAQKNNF